MTPPAVAGSLLVALVSVQQAPPTAPKRRFGKSGLMNTTSAMTAIMRRM